MKRFKKMMAIVVVAVMTMMYAVPMAFAQTETVNTGNGSITVSNAEIGKTYDLYKLFDATVGTDGSIAYSVPSDKASTVADTTNAFHTWFEIKNGNVFVKDGVTLDSSVLQSDAFKTWAEAFGTKVGGTVTASESTVKFDKIPFGYYFVKTNTGATLTVDSANPDATVVDKNQKVSFDKNIADDPDNLVKVNEAGLNEEVKFDITVNAKQYDEDQKIFKYLITDELDPGFSYLNNLVVKIVAADGTKSDPTVAPTITFKNASGDAISPVNDSTISQAKSFEVALNWTTDGTKDTDHLYDANAKINVTYSAKLDPTKASDVKVGKNPNKNKADTKYFKGSDTSTTPSGDLPDVETETYDTSVTIQKTAVNSTTALTGAQFTLTSTDGTKVVYTTETTYEEASDGTYYKLKDGTYTAEAPNGNTTHDAAYDSTTTKYKMVSTAKVMGEGQTPSTVAAYVGSDGKLTFTGLGVGTYKIEETVVPAGYNKADDIEFTISFDANKLIEDDSPEAEEGAMKANPNFGFSSNNDKIVLDSTNQVFNTTIINNKGTELPSTGGIGTTLFYLIGAILVIGAGVVLVTRRRVNAEE